MNKPEPEIAEGCINCKHGFRGSSGYKVGRCDNPATPWKKIHIAMTCTECELVDYKIIGTTQLKNAMRLAKESVHGKPGTSKKAGMGGSRGERSAEQLRVLKEA